MDILEATKRNSETINRHPWELARLEVVNSLLENKISNSKDFTVLDIGCGDIFFITELSKKYPNISFYAIDTAFTDELLDGLREEVKGRNIFLYRTMDDTAASLNKAADLVLLLDVVEHIKDDYTFLKELYNNRLVSARTFVMITVPAFQALFCSHDRFLGHYRRYTNSSLLKTVRATGFEKVEMGYFFSILIVPRIIQVLKEKFFKPKATTGLVEWNKGKWISGFLKGLLLLDFRATRRIKKITGISPPGLSNYIICKKPA